MLERSKWSLLVGLVLSMGSTSQGCGSGDPKDLKEEIRSRFPDVPQMTTEELEALLSTGGQGVVLLDVRQPREFEISHLHGARLAPDLDAALARLAGVEKDHLIVTYCSVGYRSSSLAQELARSGFSRVHNLEGSIFEWANRGLPVYREGEVVHQVHPFDRIWGRYLHRDLWAW